MGDSPWDEEPAATSGDEALSLTATGSFLFVFTPHQSSANEMSQITKLTPWSLSRCTGHFRCDRLYGLVVRVTGYRSRGPGSNPGATRLSEK
jgi:hypothetical protein